MHMEYVNFCKIVGTLFQRDFKIQGEQRRPVLCITKPALCALCGGEEMEITSHRSEKPLWVTLWERIQFRSTDFHLWFSNLQIEAIFSHFSREKK